MSCFYFAVAVALLLNSVANTNGLSCFSCSNIDNPLSCNTTSSCADSQVCYLEVKVGLYNQGCAETEQCSSINSVPGVAGGGGAGGGGGDIQEPETSGCHACCSTDNCNADLCKHYKPKCMDDETIKCELLVALFDICKDEEKARLVCRKSCKLCPVDGNWADWSAWSTCDVTCENGHQTRSRTCTDPVPANDGIDCVGTATETKVCENDICPVDGGWSQWSSWGECSATCDIGMQRRNRTCSDPSPGPSGVHCYGESRDDRICMSDACADGSWSAWGGWQGCSHTCGIGVKSRLRSCSNPKPSLLGQYCEGSPEQVLPCNTQSCPDKKVAFTAYGVRVGIPVKFPNVHHNFGGGYSTSTGKFVCPVAGLYYFSSTLTKSWNKETDTVACNLFVNGVRKVAAGEDPYSSGEDKSSYSFTISGTFHLNKGNIVYVCGCSGANYLDNSIKTSFTGFLIRPDN